MTTVFDKAIPVEFTNIWLSKIKEGMEYSKAIFSYLDNLKAVSWFVQIYSMIRSLQFVIYRIS